MDRFGIHIFLSYAREDKEKVLLLYHELQKAGYKPWMDTKDIFPGERWPSSIQKAIQSSDFFLACLSEHSVNKEGFLQDEIKSALNIWKEKSEIDIYLIPVRLDSCQIPKELENLQSLDLGDKNDVKRLLEAIQEGVERRLDVVDKRKEIRDKDQGLFRRFWNLGPQEKLYCAISTLADRPTKEYRRRTTGFGEIRGYASIFYSLVRAYGEAIYEKKIMKDSRLYFSDEFPRDTTLEKSLILLGGDDKNEITNEMFRKIELKWKIRFPYQFNYESETKLICNFRNKTKGNNIKSCEFIPEILEEEKEGEPQRRVDKDFGIIARLPNPYNPHSKLFVFAGCHTYGTAAAAKSVAAKAVLRKLEVTCKYYPDHRFFMAIVSCTMSGNYYFVDHIETFCPLDDETLEPVSEGVFFREIKGLAQADNQNC